MPFTPSTYQPLFAGGHRQTLYAWARRRQFPGLPPPVDRYFDVAPDARVLAHCHWHAEPLDRPTIVLLHGLEGSSLAHYICGISDKAWAAGWNVVRLNQRNCCNTEHLSHGLYHSGLTADVRHVIDELTEHDGVRALAVAGYSLGGNLALKLGGEAGEHPPSALKAICAVSPTMDLARCVDALERPANFVYQWNFVRNLKARMCRKAAAVPGAYALDPLRDIWTVRRFDDVYTAPHHGFRDAADYYYKASALRVVDRIRIPTLVLTADDDPFVPPATFRTTAVARNPRIRIVITPHGGHCGYVERAANGYDGYWAEREVVRFCSIYISMI